MADETYKSEAMMSPTKSGFMQNIAHRLSDSRVLTKGLPIFRHSCFGSNSSDSNSSTSSSPSTRFVPWKDLLRDPAEVMSFNSLFHSFKDNQHSQSFGFPRVIFFGEQHHEPSILRSQLQLLSILHQASTSASQNSTSGKQYRLHLILEHFSILDQDLLTAFANDRIDGTALSHAYETQSGEGFSLSHYLPLVALAKELRVPIWGGFPPRSWAKLVNREGVEAAQSKEDERMQSIDTSIIHVPRFHAWDSVTNLSPAHKCYLFSLRNPEKAPQFPPSLNASEPARLTQNETQPVFERRGFHPAQALKDAYLAHVTKSILNSQSSDGHINIALVICGLGHCEYGFGAPERLVEYLQTSKTSAELRSQRPYIIASKPQQSSIWLGEEAKISPSGHYESTSNLESNIDVQAWLKYPWNRRLADAVVLYE